MDPAKSMGERKSSLKQQKASAAQIPQQTQDTSLEQREVTGQHEINPSTGYSAAVTAKLAKEYESIADLDDVHMNTWQRQLRVNKYMVEMEVRKMVQSMLEPVYKQHEELQLGMVNIVGNRIVRLDDRIVDLEVIVYKGSTKKDRLSILEDRSNELQMSQKMFIQSIESQFEALLKRMNDVEYREQAIQKRCTIVEEAVQGNQIQIKTHEQRSTEVIERQIKAIEQYTSQTNSQVKMNTEQLILGLQKIDQVILQSLDINMQLDILKQESKNTERQIFDLAKRTAQLESGKMEACIFQEYQRQTDHQIKKNDVQLERNTNDSKACSNYMEKYLPLYIQRQMSDLLEYVFPERPIKWRINWYNEVKVPMLTAGVLADTGVESLEERIDLLHGLITKHILPSLPDETEARTPEEEFMFISLKNRAMHSKAKLIIMQLMGQIQNPAKRGSKSKLKIDLEKVTVTQLFGEMMRILKEENPELVDVMMLEGAAAAREDENDTKQAMEEDLETDQSLEARVEREVKKTIQMSTDAIEHKLSEAQDRNIEMLNRLQKQGEDQLNSRCTTIQGYIQEVHKFQIDEMDNFKQCHQMYLYSAQQFDRKIALIFDIEKNYQQMLIQVKALNNIITEISGVNLLILNGKPLMKDSATENETQQSLVSGVTGKQIIINSSPEKKEHTSVLPTAIQSNGNVSRTTRVTGSQRDNFVARARSGEHFGRQNAQSVVTNYEPVEPMTMQPTELLQIAASSRPKTQMQARQKNYQSRINTQFATVNNNRTLGTGGSSNTDKQSLFQTAARKLSETVTMQQKLMIGGASNSNCLTQDQVGDVFAKVQQKAIKNSKKIENMILEDKLDYSNIPKDKRKQPKPVMPTADSFRRELVNFQYRLQDTSVVDKLEGNILSEIGKRGNVHTFVATKPNQINLGPLQKMNLGVRREEADSDGNKFLRQPDSNAVMFQEPKSVDGKIDNFNKAAGLEHQANKHVNELIFDKKAVIQSVKNFM